MFETKLYEQYCYVVFQSDCISSVTGYTVQFEPVCEDNMLFYVMKILFELKFLDTVLDLFYCFQFKACDNEKV